MSTEVQKKTLLLVAYWKPKKGGGRTNHFDLKTSEDVPKKTAENAQKVGITFAAKADVTDEKLLSTSYTSAKAATSKATAAGFDVITSQAIALQVKKANAPAAPAAPIAAAPGGTVVNEGGTAVAAAPAMETSAPEPIQTPAPAAAPVEEVAAPVAEAPPADHTVVYDNEHQPGTLPVE